jgi:hypothetical protein
MDKAEDPSILMRAVAELPSQTGIYRSQKHTFAQAQAEESQMKAVWICVDRASRLAMQTTLRFLPIHAREVPSFAASTRKTASEISK